MKLHTLLFTENSGIFSCLLALLIIVSSSTYAADCIIYEDINRGGAFFSRDAGWNVSYVGDDWNDQGSSVWVRHGYKLTIYEHIDFGGVAYTFWGSGYLPPSQYHQATPHKAYGGHWYNLTDYQMNWNDALSSFKCKRE